MNQQEDIQKTHIIALTPKEDTMVRYPVLGKLFCALNQNAFYWPHLTIAQYTQPIITPTVCYQLRNISRYIPPISLTTDRLHFWKKSGVLLFQFHKTRELVEIYKKIRRIFWDFFPYPYLKKWYFPTALWSPHVSLSYNLDASTAIEIIEMIKPVKVLYIFDKIVLRDFDTQYKEYVLNGK